MDVPGLMLGFYMKGQIKPKIVSFRNGEQKLLSMKEYVVAIL